MNQVEADFPQALKDFPRHVIMALLGFVYSWLTQIEDLFLLIGCLLITKKIRRGIGAYLLTWTYFRQRKIK